MSETTEKTRRRPAKGPRFGVAQVAPALGDIERNLELHAAAVEKARKDKVDVLVFPELSVTGYRLKDMVPEVAAQREAEVFSRLAEMSKDISIVVGLVEETDQHFFYNGAAYFEDGKLLHCKRKVYLPTYGMFDEQRYFARGNRVTAFDTAHGRVAILICEEMLHPTAATVAALDGATTLIVPSASPARGIVADAPEGEAAVAEPSAGTGEVDANGRHWESYNRVMARSLGVHVVYCNRAGVEDGHTYWGGSEIVGPSGETLAKASYYEEDTVSAVLPEDSVRRRRISSPLLRDEDLDLTINELSRIRGRKAPAEDSRSQSGQGHDSRDRRDTRPPWQRDDRSRGGQGGPGGPGGGGGRWNDRGDRRGDRGGDRGWGRRDDRFSGDRSYGDRNRGDRNGGDRSYGDRNRGDRNGGDRSWGDRNRGDRNGGDRSWGDRNRGDRNGGDRSWGDRNRGDRNGGDRSWGDRDRGDRSGGDRRQWSDRGRGRDDRPDFRRGGHGDRPDRSRGGRNDRPDWQGRGREDRQNWQSGGRRDRSDWQGGGRGDQPGRGRGNREERSYERGGSWKGPRDRREEMLQRDRGDSRVRDRDMDQPGRDEPPARSRPSTAERKSRGVDVDSALASDASSTTSRKTGGNKG